ncbi:MAG TPA: heparin lyase I family protein [Crinalium sp.]
MLSNEITNSTQALTPLPDPLTPKNPLDATLSTAQANTALGTAVDTDINRWVKAGSGRQLAATDESTQSLVGDEKANLLRGGSSRDFIYGRGGSDRLLGRSGNDVMSGEAGNDILAGGSGNDTLRGGSGRDNLVGDSGRDRFVLAETPAKTKVSSADIIRDFTNGQDTIQLSGGLTFERLRILQGKGKNAQDTLLRDSRTGKYVAVLKGVDSRTIDRNDFDGALPEPPIPTPKNDSNVTLDPKPIVAPPPLPLAPPSPDPKPIASSTPKPTPRANNQSLSKLMFFDDFEDGSIAKWSPERPLKQSIQVVQSPSGDGKAVRFELNRNDRLVHGGKRAELALDKIPANSERWYGYRIMLPTSWQTDGSQEIVTQWHDYPDFALGEDWRSPPLAITVHDNEWGIDNRWDPKRVTKNNDPTPEGGTDTLWTGPYQKGVWTDWVVHAKWSAKADGLLQIWKDGVLVVNKRGPNTYNDEYAPYFKVGIYKPSWKLNPAASSVDKRVLYFDQMRVGDGSVNYTDVSRR